MATPSISFKNCRQSVALKERIETLAADLTTLVRTSPLKRLHVTVSEENGLRAEGPDVFACVVVARTVDERTWRFEAKASSAYDAVEEAFTVTRRAVREAKRAHIDRRNDWSRKTPARRMGGVR